MLRKKHLSQVFGEIDIVAIGCLSQSKRSILKGSMKAVVSSGHSVARKLPLETTKDEFILMQTLPIVLTLDI